MWVKGICDICKNVLNGNIVCGHFKFKRKFNIVCNYYFHFLGPFARLKLVVLCLTLTTVYYVPLSGGVVG